jgi:kynureninase
VRVIPDFRTPDNIRLGLTPLYTTFDEVHRAMTRIKTIVEEGIYKDFSDARRDVTDRDGNRREGMVLFS